LPLLITIVVAIGAIFVIAGIIVMQLNDVEHRIKQLAKGQSTDHNASGPIARLLLNWLQATALLSTIKLTPPEAVQDVTVYADYAQGISTNCYRRRNTRAAKVISKPKEKIQVVKEKTRRADRPYIQG
jgi:hypothetical protein